VAQHSDGNAQLGRRHKQSKVAEPQNFVPVQMGLTETLLDRHFFLSWPLKAAEENIIASIPSETNKKKSGGKKKKEKKKKKKKKGKKKK